MTNWVWGAKEDKSCDPTISVPLDVKPEGAGNQWLYLLELGQRISGLQQAFPTAEGDEDVSG